MESEPYGLSAGMFSLSFFYYYYYYYNFALVHPSSGGGAWLNPPIYE